MSEKFVVSFAGSACFGIAAALLSPRNRIQAAFAGVLMSVGVVLLDLATMIED